MNSNSIKPLTFALVALLFTAIDFVPSTFAQEATGVSETVLIPVDALNRGTPRSSITGFLEASSDFDFEKAAEYLDMRKLPIEARQLEGPELARQFNYVISRTVWLDDHSISNHPEGEKGDGLPKDRDQLIVFETSTGDIPFWMQHVPRADGQLIWKVSNRSVAQIPALYKEFSYPLWVERVRSWFPPDASFLGLELFKWLILLVLGLLSWPVFYFLGVLVVRLFISPKRPTFSLWRQVFTGPLVAIGILIVVSLAFIELGAGALAQKLGNTHTLSMLVFIWASWVIIDLVKKYQLERLSAQGRPGAAQLMRPLTTLLKVSVLLLGALFWLNNIGVNITAVLAGLGVGGLALALALQKPLEDMMGTLSLFAQAPIKVNDLCRYDDVLGRVEEIGLRSTRIRTLTNTVVHIPNALFAHAKIENLTSRTKIRFWPTLRLRYDTSPKQLRAVLSEIQIMLEQHQQVYDEPMRVRLTEFADDAFLIKLNAYMITTDFAESLEIGQDLIFRIVDIMHENEVRFALPGSSIYMEENS